jgi:uncharacterized membrane protein
MKKIYTFLTLLLIMFGMGRVTKVRAADEGWVIDNFHSEIQIRNDAKVMVVETIEVDFFDLQKHGIYRNIPIKYKGSGGNSLKVRFNVLDVTDQKNNKLKYQQNMDGNDVVLKIGHPNIFVTGKQTYVISYELERVITTPHDQAELYWNVTGLDWPVPITKSSAIITGEDNLFLESVCFEGVYGAGNECQKELTDSEATFSSGFLNVGQGLTVVVKIDKSKVNLPTDWQKLKWFLYDNWLYLSPLLTLGLMIWLYWHRGRDKEYQNIFSETGSKKTSLFSKVDGIMTFAPPENLSAGEVGVLVDEKVDTRDITAVIIDLASRGFLTIKDVIKKGLLSRNTIELINNKQDELNLLPFEKSVLDMLFTKSRKDSTHLNKLHTRAYDDMQRVIKELYEHLTEEKYFTGNPRTVRGLYMALGIGIIFLGNMVAASGFGGLIESGGGHFAAVISGIIVLAFSFFMPARTPKGRKALKEIVGLKEWIRIGAWREKIHEKNNFIEEVLPYTIAFGLTKKFVKALKDSDLKNIDWYQSNQPINITNFAHAMDSFGGSVSKAVASSRPSTSSSGGSGFSGGGSGGGFGGGGGGSW